MAKVKAASNLEGESVSGYFRRLFRENPKLLRAPSSQPLLDRYLEDHPEETEVPKRVIQILYNVKSILRSKKRKRKAKALQETPAATGNFDVSPPRESTVSNELEVLEEQIDECLSLAKSLDREGLENVINHLRRARNEVVVKQSM
jgi:hypothetical protein